MIMIHYQRLFRRHALMTGVHTTHETVDNTSKLSAYKLQSAYSIVESILSVQNDLRYTAFDRITRSMSVRLSKGSLYSKESNKRGCRKIPALIQVQIYSLEYQSLTSTPFGGSS